MGWLDKFASLWIKVSGYIFVAALTYVLINWITYADTQPMPPTPPMPPPPIDVVRQAEVVALWCDTKKCREDTLICLSETEAPDYLRCFVEEPKI